MDLEKYNNAEIPTMVSREEHKDLVKVLSEILVNAIKMKNEPRQLGAAMMLDDMLTGNCYKPYHDDIEKAKLPF